MEKLYKSHLEIDPQNIDALVALFHNLPVGGPVEPRHFGLNVDMIFQHQLELWKQRVVESASFAGTIADAWSRQLDVVKLFAFLPCCPLPILPSGLVLPASSLLDFC